MSITRPEIIIKSCFEITWTKYYLLKNLFRIRKFYNVIPPVMKSGNVFPEQFRSMLHNLLFTLDSYDIKNIFSVTLQTLTIKELTVDDFNLLLWLFFNY